MQSVNERRKQIEFQSHMLTNLKIWIRNLSVLSTFILVLAYWAIGLHDGTVYNVIGGISIVGIIICLVLIVIIGLAYKNGKTNIDKIMRSLS